MGYTSISGTNSEVPLSMEYDGLFDTQITYSTVEYIGFLNGNWFLNPITSIGRLSLLVSSAQTVNGTISGYSNGAFHQPIFGSVPAQSYRVLETATVSQLYPLSGSSGGSIQYWGLFGGTAPTIAEIFSSSLRELIDPNSPLQITGTSFADVLIGKSQNDSISGGLGKDTIHGEEGDDDIHGGAGSDDLFGGGGEDMLMGGNGNDYISSGSGDDTVKAGKGDDTVLAGSGSETVDGGQGTDTYIIDFTQYTGPDLTAVVDLKSETAYAKELPTVNDEVVVNVVNVTSLGDLE
ncbi:MAG: calcium-binding protein, partial [Chloroflexota bacterium]